MAPAVPLALRRLASAALVAGFALAALSACQLALNADDADPSCDLDDETLCGFDRICRSGRCVICVPGEEICNGRDDDCNGSIDDGFDEDGDGYGSCTPDKTKLDCNDDPVTGASIFPGATEVCNGFDDNCNGKTDDEPNDCSDKGLECWSDEARCVTRGDCRLHGCTKGGCNPDTGACTSADCVELGTCPDPTTRCDAKTRTCVKIARLGDACDTTIVCDTAQGQCVATDVLGLAGKTGSICATACCSTDQCPASFVCRASGNGSSMCVRASDAGITIGGKAVLSSCTAGSECRSGVCLSGACTDVCCAGTTCGASGSCAIRSGDRSFLCRATGGAGAYNASCTSSTSCKSGWCVDPSSFWGGWCTKHCCTSADCGSEDRCEARAFGSGIVTSCQALGYSEYVGSLLGGAGCSVDSDCRSGHCIQQRCDDTCCTDSDCARGTLCLPRKDANGSPMHCVAAE